MRWVDELSDREDVGEAIMGVVVMGMVVMEETWSRMKCGNRLSIWDQVADTNTVLLMLKSGKTPPHNCCVYESWPSNDPLSYSKENKSYSRKDVNEAEHTSSL